MTEDEAKTKWCPHVRHAVLFSQDTSTGATANRDNGSEHYGVGDCNCLGAACMSWRWERATVDAPSCIRHPGDTGAAVDPHGFWHRDGKPTGFCGLAGRPS